MARWPSPGPFCRWLAALQVSWLLAAAVGASGEAAAPPERDLATWLRGLSVRLPDSSESRRIWPLGNISLETHDVECSGFTIARVEVSMLPGTASERGAALSVSGAGAERCHGAWRASRGSTILSEGGFSFQIGDSTLDLPVLFDASAPRRPLSVPHKGCRTSVRMEGLRFDGDVGIFSKAFARLLQSTLNFGIDHLGCYLPNAALAHANEQIGSWMHVPEPPRPSPPPELPEAASTARLVDWQTDVPLLLDLPNASGGAADLRSLVARATRGTDRLAGDASAHGFPELSLGKNWSEQLGLRVAANLTNVSIEGLGSAVECAPLAPAPEERHSLRASCGFRALRVSVALTIELEPLQASQPPICRAGSALALDVAFAATMREPEVLAQVLLAADRARLDTLTVDGLLRGRSLLTAVGTLAAAAYAVNVTELDVRATTVERMSLEQDGGPLGAMLAESVTTFVDTFLQAPDVQHVITNALAEGVFPHVRRVLNEHSALALAVLSPLADPAGGAMDPGEGGAIDYNHVAWMTFAATCGFLPLMLLVYVLAHVHFRKRVEARTQAFNVGSAPPASLLEPSRTCAASSLASACSVRVQRGLPFFIVVSMAVGFWSILVPVVDVRAKAVGGMIDPTKPIADDSLLVYSFFELVHDFAESGAWISSVLLVMGCIVVPQGVAILMAITFVKPMSWLLRGRLLALFMVVLRLICVTQCFLSLVVCILRAHLEVPGMTFDIVGEPVYGVVSGTAATYLALLLLGVQYFYHNRAFMQIQELATPEQTASPVAARVSRRAAQLALLGAAAALASLLGAFTSQLLSLRLSGIGGIVEDSPFSTRHATKDLWLVLLPSELCSATDMKLVALFVGSLLVLLSMVAPVLCCAAWLVQWAWVVATGTEPHSSPSCIVRRCAHASPYLYGWCATDVVLVTSIASCVEMDLPLQFIVKKKAGPLCAILERASGQPCVHADGELHAGGWLLLVTVLLSFSLFVYTTWAFEPRPRCSPAADGEECPQEPSVAPPRP